LLESLRDTLTYALTGKRPDKERTPEDEEFDSVAKWTKELELAEKFVTSWHSDGDRVVDQYLDEHNESLPTRPKYKLNLFHANITTLMSIMFAQMPKVEADRRFADPNDDVARVASEIMTRVLQNDMNDPEDTYIQVLRQALQDRLLSGLGVARVRYGMEEKEVPEEGVEYDDETPVPTEKSDEWCDMEYVHWRDVLWSPCRTEAEKTWEAYRAYMKKDEVIARFGDDIARAIPYKSRGPSLDPNNGKAAEIDQGDEAQAEVWEIWDKTTKCVYWYVKGYGKFLDKKENPMELTGFWPGPRWMVANLTTKKYIPRPDFMLAADLYDEINELEARIALLTKACKVIGVYASNAEELKRLLTDATESNMVPVENWAMFADKGGIKGMVDYFPVKDVAEALGIVVTQQQLRIQQLYQVTGMSDILRGQATQTGVTATEQKIKAQFASTRIQFFQEEFATFASELLNKKVDLIRNFYDEQRILELSNILETPDAEHAQAAVALIKDKRKFNCRVVVQSESMAMVDYENLKQERAEFIGAIGQFVGQVQPLVESQPATAPFMLELLKFGLAGLKGSRTMEGVVDRMIAQIEKSEREKAGKPPEPTPEEKVEQMKVQGQIQVAQAKGQADLVKAQQEFQLEQQRMQAELAMQREEFALKQQQMQETHRMDMAKLILEIQGMKAKLGMEREKLAIQLEGAEQEQIIRAESAEQEASIRQNEAKQDAEIKTQSAKQDAAIAKQKAKQQPKAGAK
jgi:hypothetical protein